MPIRYVIVHTGDRQALIIDDEEAHRQVVERMLAENVSVLTDFSAWAP